MSIPTNKEELQKAIISSYSKLKDDFNSLIIKLDKTVETILLLKLYEVTWYEKWTLGRMIQFNTSSAYLNAKNRIRKWKKNSKY